MSRKLSASAVETPTAKSLVFSATFPTVAFAASSAVRMGCGASSNAAQKYELGAADAIPLRKDVPPGGSTNIEWQSLAPSHADAPDTLGDAAPTGEKIDATMEAVFAVFADPLFSGPPPPFETFFAPDADFSPAFPWILARCKLINQLGGPRMRVFHWETLERMGRIPRWPDDRAHILDLEDLLAAWIERMDARGKIRLEGEDRVLCLSMFSHRWTRPSVRVEEAHPDTPDGRKAAAMAAYGRGGNCGVFPNHQFEYFFWVDFAGVHQTDLHAKVLGVATLPLYVAACSEIIFYHTDSYEGRAWTRLERVIGYAFNPAPMFVFIDDGYGAPGMERPSPEKLAAEHACFSLDEQTGGLLMAINDPLGEGAGITSDADRILVEKLLHQCLRNPPLQAALKESFGANHDGLDLASCKFAVDVEHYRMDCEQAKALLEKRNQNVMSALT